MRPPRAERRNEAGERAAEDALEYLLVAIVDPQQLDKDGDAARRARRDEREAVDRRVCELCSEREEVAAVADKITVPNQRV